MVGSGIIARAALLTGLGAFHGALAADSPFKIDTRDDILASARTIAFDLVSLYKGNQTGETPGILSGPPPIGDYYWWEAAGFWGTLIDYFRLTGDESYNAIITQGLLHQRSEGDNFLPPNVTAQLGNSDQCMWGLTALLAAENQFPNPTGGAPEWSKLAENVFDNLNERWKLEVENGTCGGGGLRWQIPVSNNGYNYKETFSTVCYLNLGARLARYTGKTSYSDAAGAAYDWLSKIGYIDEKTWEVYDGAHVEQNCTDINKIQFSYSPAALAQGMAFLYNTTSGDSQATWKTRVEGLTTATLKQFFPSGVAVERACENNDLCATDMVAFKGYLHRWLAVVTQVAPFTAGTINPVLKSSAKAAVAQCTGGNKQRACGFFWADGKFITPKTTGVGEQMSALGAVESLLIEGKAPATKDSKTSGTGSGSGGGSTTGSGSGPATTKKPSAAGRVEAGYLMLAAAVGVYLLAV